MPNEERIRQIFREEIKRHVFSQRIQIMDGRNIQTGLTTGTKIATETTQKLGFWSKTPAIQPVATIDPTGKTEDQDNEARQAINNIIDKLQSIGLMSA